MNVLLCVCCVHVLLYESFVVCLFCGVNVLLCECFVV